MSSDASNYVQISFIMLPSSDIFDMLRCVTDTFSSSFDKCFCQTATDGSVNLTIMTCNDIEMASYTTQLFNLLSHHNIVDTLGYYKVCIPPNMENFSPCIGSKWRCTSYDVQNGQILVIPNTSPQYYANVVS